MIRGRMAHAPMSQPASPTRVEQKRGLRLRRGNAQVAAMAMIAPAPTQTPSTAADDRLAATDDGLDQVTGHAGEVQSPFMSLSAAAR
jgi:hypothetical protein